jgi:hypothetical protein
VVLANGREKCGACDFGGSTDLVRLVGVSISLEKNFYRLPFTPPPSGRLIGPSTVPTSSHGVHLICLVSLGSWLSTHSKSTIPHDLSSKSSSDFAKDRKLAIEVEVCKLLAAEFIRECKHLVWLAISVLVPKKTAD